MYILVLEQVDYTLSMFVSLVIMSAFETLLLVKATALSSLTSLPYIQCELI